MIDPTKRSLKDIAADLDLSEAQVARGETVPLDQALRRAWREGVECGDAGPLDWAELRAAAAEELRAASKES